MKKILFAAVAALAITGCSQNEEIEKAAKTAEIGFNSVVSKTTRATSVNLDVLKTNGFTVYAYNTGNDAIGTGALAKNIIDKEPIAWNSTDKWHGSKAYYWPNSGKIQFFAYSSKNVTGLTAQSSDVYPTIVDYEVPADATKQEDLLVAKANDLTKTDAKVNFIFSHALTQVNFSIKSKVNDGLTYEVTDISISEVGNKATYNYGTGWSEPTATTSSYTYPISKTATDNQVAGDASTVKILDTSNLMMLLLQTLSNKAKILVKYKVMDKNGDTVYGDALTTGKEIVIGDGTTKWGMGKKVRYTLALTNNATSIGWEVTSVDEWTKDNEEDKGVETPAE